MKKIINVVTVASTLGSSLISGVTPSLAEDEVNNNEVTLENEYVEENVKEGKEVNDSNQAEEVVNEPTSTEEPEIDEKQSSAIEPEQPIESEDEVNNNEATLENEYVEENVNKGEEVNDGAQREEQVVDESNSTEEPEIDKEQSSTIESEQPKEFEEIIESETPTQSEQPAEGEISYTATFIQLDRDGNELGRFTKTRYSDPKEEHFDLFDLFYEECWYHEDEFIEQGWKFVNASYFPFDEELDTDITIFMHYYYQPVLYNVYYIDRDTKETVISRQSWLNGDDDVDAYIIETLYLQDGTGLENLTYEVTEDHDIYIYGDKKEEDPIVIPEEGMWVWDTDTYPTEPVGFKVPLTIYYRVSGYHYNLHKEVIEYEPGSTVDFKSEYGNKVFENYELGGDYGVTLHVNKDGVYDKAELVLYYNFVGENLEDLPEYRLPLWNTYIDSTTGDIIKSEIGEGSFKLGAIGGDPSDWYLYQGSLPEGYRYVEHSGRYEFEKDENDNIIKASLVVDVMRVASESDLKTYTVTYWNVDSLNSEPIMAIDMQLDLRRINDVSYIEKATAQSGTGWDYYVYQSHKVDGDTIHVYYKEVILPTEGTVEFKVNYRDEKAGVIIEGDTIKLDVSKLNDDSYIEEALKAHLVDSGYTYMAENYVYQNYTISYKDMSIDAVFNLDLGEEEEQPEASEGVGESIVAGHNHTSEIETAVAVDDKGNVSFSDDNVEVIIRDKSLSFSNAGSPFALMTASVPVLTAEKEVLIKVNENVEDLHLHIDFENGESKCFTLDGEPELRFDIKSKPVNANVYYNLKDEEAEVGDPEIPIQETDPDKPSDDKEEQSKTPIENEEVKEVATPDESDPQENKETVAEKEIIVTGLGTGAIGLAIGAAFVSIGWKVNNKRGK